MLGIATISIVSLVAYFTKQRGIYSKDSIYMVSSHEAGHCLADEFYFNNSVDKVEIEDASINDIIRYIQMYESINDKNRVTIPGGKTYLKDIEYTQNPSERDFYFNKAVCLWSGFEAARTLAYTDKMGLDAISGMKKDEEEMEKDLLIVMKFDKIISENLDRADEILNDDAGEYYYKLRDEVINKSKEIIETHKDELILLTDELVKKRKLNGNRIRELLKINISNK